MATKFFLSTFIVLTLGSCASLPDEKQSLADEIEYSIQNEMLNKWYPAVIDSIHGGYLSTWTYDWRPTGEQDKMIVTQARHIWTSSKAYMAYPEKTYYRKCAEHGFRFLRDKMWDKQYGGFHTLVSREGNVKSGANEEKTAYGVVGLLHGYPGYRRVESCKEGIHVAGEP
jgi:cellobiose epimerase